MTPGDFLRQRREEAGLTVYDVALVTDTTVPICARDRAALIEAIEADLVMASFFDLKALAEVYGFELNDLGSGLVDQSQKVTVAARATAEKKTVGQRS